MNIVACMCTFPARGDLITPSIRSLMGQVDKIRLCLNGYSEIPDFLLEYENVECIFPKKDQRDVGKFLDFDIKDEHIILYVDDDIIYPDDYAKTMASKLQSEDDSAIGLHGVIYPDAYDGDVALRRVFTFSKMLERDRKVNQLGTGTVCIKAKHRPSHAFMEGSEKYVDVRFAIHCKHLNLNLICMERKDNWLKEIEHSQSIFSSFTKKWPISVCREVQEITGYSKLTK